MGPAVQQSSLPAFFEAPKMPMNFFSGASDFIYFIWLDYRCRPEGRGSIWSVADPCSSTHPNTATHCRDRRSVRTPTRWTRQLVYDFQQCWRCSCTRAEPASSCSRSRCAGKRWWWSYKRRAVSRSAGPSSRWDRRRGTSRQCWCRFLVEQITRTNCWKNK